MASLAEIVTRFMNRVLAVELAHVTVCCSRFYWKD